MPADPTQPPVPAEALEAAEIEFCQRFAVASNPEAMTAFRAALAAAAVPLVAAGRTAAAALTEAERVKRAESACCKATGYCGIGECVTDSAVDSVLADLAARIAEGS